VKTLLIASANKGKIKEFKRFLSDLPLELVAQPEGLKVEETGISFAENARLKAIAVARSTGEIALADDSGLSVKSLNGAPGIFSTRYANSDSERIVRLLKDLEEFSDRSAFFSAALCLASPTGKVLFEVEGICNGLISYKPRGKNGFGYDPVFEVNGTNLTYAEMEPQQKKLLGHRGRALEGLLPGLKKIFDF